MSGREQKPWNHRPFHAGDLAGVAELRENARVLTEGSERRSGEPGYYRWKLQRNPAGEGFLEVATDPEGRVVGTASLTPKRVFLDGVEHPAAEIGDTFTSPDYQRQGIFSTLVRALVAGGGGSGVSFIYGTPNEASLPGYEAKLNFGRIPGSAVAGLVRPVHPIPVLRRRLGGGLLGAAASWVAGPVISLVYGALFRPRRAEEDIEVRDGPPDGEAVEGLFRRVRSEYRWIVARDGPYMTWRFAENPDSYDFLGAYRAGRLAAYVALKRGRWNGLDVLYLADFLAEDEGAFAALVGAALRRAGSSDMVSAWTCVEGLHARVLRRAGFVRYGDVPVICHRDALGEEVIAGSRRWHFTMADSDNI